MNKRDNFKTKITNFGRKIEKKWTFLSDNFFRKKDNVKPNFSEKLRKITILDKYFWEI